VALKAIAVRHLAQGNNAAALAARMAAGKAKEASVDAFTTGSGFWPQDFKW